MAISDKILYLRTGIGVTIRDLRVVFERVGRLPFHDQRIDALVMQLQGQGLQGRHWHRLDAEVEVEAFDDKILLGRRLGSGDLDRGLGGGHGAA